MDAKTCDKCLEPKVKNSWDRKKTFFEGAAAQSSLKRPNPDLPDSLLSPLITVLDPCTIHSAIHARVDWTIVEARLKRSTLFGQQSRSAPQKNRLEIPVADIEGSSDGGASNCSSPFYPGARENRGGEPMDISNYETAEDIALRKEKDTFMDEIVDLVRIIKKHNDGSLSSSPTWIDRLLVEKISKQLIMIQNYLPDILKIDEIVNALLFENGPAIMENLLIEMPENLVTIVNILITNHMSGNRTRYRNLMIGKIISLYPYFAKRIITKFSEKRSDCVFACRLAVDHLSDKQFLQFMEPMMVEKESTIYKIVVRSANRQILHLIVQRLLLMAEAIVLPNPELPSAPSEMGVSPWCTSLAYCLVELLISSMEPWKEHEIVTVTKFVFRTTIKASPSPIRLDSESEPMDTSFVDEIPSSQDSVVPDSEPESSVQHRPPQMRPGTTVEPSPFGEAHECFVLAALVAVPFFTQFIPRFPANQTAAVQPPDRAVDDWLEISRRRVLIGEKVTSTFGSQFIYVHACIFSSRTDYLTDFASAGVKQQIDFAQKQNHAAVLKNALNTRSLTDIEVTQRSICQKVTQSSAKENALPLRSVHILQEGNAYSVFQINIEPWLEEQLEYVSLPVSKDLEDIVDAFAQFVGVSLDRRGLSEAFILKTFSGDMFDPKTLPKRLLVFLYICSYRESAHRLDASLRHVPYNHSIFRKIPVRYLLSIMDHRYNDFVGIRYKIMSRITMIYPYSLPTPDSMRIVSEIEKSPMMGMEQFENSKDHFLCHLREIGNIQKVMETISRSDARCQLAALPVFINLFMESLNPSTHPGFELALMSVFDLYEQLDPFPLFFQSTSTWIQSDTNIDIEDVVKIPSLLFRCDRRILSSPPHFYCFVRALNFFNKKARADNRLKTLECQAKAEIVSEGGVQRRNPNLCSSLDYDGDRREKELLTASYLDSQHSILIHALIEVCDSKRMKDDPSDFVLREKRQQIRRIAFKYIHRTFLDHEALIRVVLFQKLPLRQVRDLVEGIPSLYPGVFQVPDMLALPDQQRRFFAIVFTAEICRKYRVHEALVAARSVIDFVHSLHKFGELPSSYKIWKHVAPALMLLATEFPSLADSINRLLMRVSAAAKNRLAVRSGVFASDPRHEEYQLIARISSFLDRNSTRL